MLILQPYWRKEDNMLFTRVIIWFKVLGKIPKREYENHISALALFSES